MRSDEKAVAFLPGNPDTDRSRAHPSADPDTLIIRWSLVRIQAELDPERYARAAPRWHARFVLAAAGIGLEDSSLALAALHALPGPNGENAAATLRRLAEAYSLSGVAAILD